MFFFKNRFFSLFALLGVLIFSFGTEARIQSPQDVVDQFFETKVDNFMEAMEAQQALLSSIYEQSLKLEVRKPLAGAFSPGIDMDLDFLARSNHDNQSMSVAYDVDFEMEEQDWNSEKIKRISMASAGEMRMLQEDLYMHLKSFDISAGDVDAETKKRIMELTNRLKGNWVHMDLEPLLQNPEFASVYDAFAQNPLEMQKAITKEMKMFLQSTRFMRADSDNLKRVGNDWVVPVVMGAKEFREMGENGVEAFFNLKPILATTPEMEQVFAMLEMQAESMDWDEIEQQLEMMGIKFEGVLSVAVNNSAEDWSLKGAVQTGGESFMIEIDCDPYGMDMVLGPKGEELVVMIRDQKMKMAMEDAFEMTAQKTNNTWAGKVVRFETGEYDLETFEYTEFAVPRAEMMAEFEFTANWLDGTGWVKVYNDGELEGVLNVDVWKVSPLGDKFMIDMNMKEVKNGKLKDFLSMTMDYEYHKKSSLSILKPRFDMRFEELVASIPELQGLIEMMEGQNQPTYPNEQYRDGYDASYDAVDAAPAIDDLTVDTPSDFNYDEALEVVPYRSSYDS